MLINADLRLITVHKE